MKPHILRTVAMAVLLSRLAWAQPSHIALRPWTPNILIPSVRPHAFRVDHQRAIDVTAVDVRVDILESTGLQVISLRDGIE